MIKHAVEKIVISNWSSSQCHIDMKKVWQHKTVYKLTSTLEGQTQVDSKPAGQSKHTSLNQCQLIAANRPKLMLWAPPAGGRDKVSL